MTDQRRQLLPAFALAVVVSSPALAQWVTPAVAAPRVEYRTFQSDAAGTAVSYHIYTPPAYDANPLRRFPVLYWLHGAGSPTGGIASVSGWFDGAIAAGLIPPMLVVFPNGMSYGMWCNSKDGTVPMETVVIGDLIPEIDANFRTIGERAGRIVEGFSMGGYGAARLGFRHHDLFAGVSMLGAGPMQSDFLDEPPGTNFPLQLRLQIYENVWGSDPAYYLTEHPLTIVQHHAASIIMSGQVIRQAVGQLDAMLGPNAAFHALLVDFGVPHEYTTPAGVGHSTLPLMTALGEQNWEFYRAVLSSPCPGDINGDGFVNLDDFIILAGNFGSGPGMTPQQGDLNGDGFVNLDDFIILAGNFGNDCN
ncbi:MAG: esterase family protein [Phycisphaeraceae bacterium]|nr:MAG: esterase family protein [Phycisphaeraceae bacterium]